MKLLRKIIKIAAILAGSDPYVEGVSPWLDGFIGGDAPKDEV